MLASIIINILLAILIVFLLYKLNRRAKEKEQVEKQEKREWMLKIALEQSCRLPSVEADELAAIEPELNRLMNNANNDKSVEEKIRKLIMSLYEEKTGRGNKNEKGGAPERG